MLLATILTGANAYDVSQVKPWVEAIPPVRGKQVQPRQRPDCVQGELGYDSEPHRAWLRQLGIEPPLAKRNAQNDSGLGIYRWMVERTPAWLRQFRRLRRRNERRPELYKVFMTLAKALIWWRLL